MCNKVDITTLGVFPDRVALSGISVSGITVTCTGAFVLGDVNKALVIYNSALTEFPTARLVAGGTTYTSISDMLANAPIGQSNICRVDNGGTIQYYGWDSACNSQHSGVSGSGWVLLKPREAIATTIVNYIDADTVEVDFNFGSSVPSGLTGVMGTDNFSAFQSAIDYCIDSNFSLCIPDGDYLVLFNDDSTLNKNRLRLYKGTSSRFEMTGSGAETTRIFYEFERREWVFNVFGMGILNTVSSNSYYARLSDLQIAGPSYQQKLRDFCTNGSIITNSYGISCLGPSSEIELDNVTVDGHKNLSILVGMTDADTSTLTISNCYLARGFAIGLAEFGDEKKVNVINTTIDNIGLTLAEAYACRTFGTAFYAHIANTFSFNNCIFTNNPRHTVGMFASNIPDIDYFPYSRVLFQEFINCKFIDTGSISTDWTFPNMKFIGCQFINVKGLSVTTSCEIIDCTFLFDKCLNPTGTTNYLVSPEYAIGLATLNYSNGTISEPVFNATPNYTIKIRGCNFINQRPLEAGPHPGSENVHFIFESCEFVGGAAGSQGGGTLIWLRGNERLTVKNCVFKDFDYKHHNGSSTQTDPCDPRSSKADINSYVAGANSAILLENTGTVNTSFSRALLVGNLFELNVNVSVIWITSRNQRVELIDNTINNTNPIRIETQVDGSGQITGRNNFFINLTSFNFLQSPHRSQLLLGRRACFENRIELDSGFTGYLGAVNFNFDFYKLSTEEPGTVTIHRIAFDVPTPARYQTTSRTLFNGVIRLMALYDTPASGGIALIHNDAIADGNIRTADGLDYTIKPNEVVELYFDPESEFFHLIR